MPVQEARILFQESDRSEDSRQKGGGTGKAMKTKEPMDTKTRQARE